MTGRGGAWAKRALAVFGSVLVTVTGLTVLAPSPSAAAVSASSFQPGNIISDANFYNGAAMTEAQIQSFLVSKGSALANLRSTAKSRPAAVSDVARPGHVYCSAITGGSNLLSSTIIYRVQAACGISAKAIIVTLEKERSLITGRFDSTSLQAALNVAMGYGCPDTAACNTDYYGLDNQLYLAARQFKYYQLPENGFRYRPGNFYIQYHPNAACGGTNVNIRNYATAGLYNYTPYQPNAASLAAFPGTGDGCSSYGNRNFWFIYNGWFGSPLANDGAFEIRNAYAASGGAAGPLGAEVKTLECPASTVRCWHQYENGYITWTSGGGAVVVSGAIAQRYRDLGGPTGSLGYASSAAGSFEVPANGNGDVQIFAGGYLYSSSAGVFRVQNGTPIETAWIAEGWIRGSLGWPTSDQRCIATGACSLDFQHGTLVSAPGGAIVDGPIGDAYTRLGGPSGALGYPTSGATQMSTVNGDGSVQVFQGGYLYSSAAGVFKVTPGTAVSDAWNASGWVRGSLGWPAGEMVCDGAACSQQFQHGTLYARAGVAGAVTDPTIAAAYAAAGGPSGALGYPTTVTTQLSTVNGDGSVQVFQGGYLYSSVAGVFKVTPGTAVSDAWNASGWVRGSLGWPAGEMVCDGAACSQQFQHGTLTRPKR